MSTDAIRSPLQVGLDPGVSRHSRETVRGRLVTRAAAIAFSLVATACSQAQDSMSAPQSPVRSVAELTGFATTTPKTKDFVEKTRPASVDFLPVGVVPPARPLKARTPAEVKALESELDSTLQQHNAVSGRKASGQRYSTAAGDPPAAQAPRGGGRFLIKPRPVPAPAAATPARNRTKFDPPKS